MQSHFMLYLGSIGKDFAISELCYIALFYKGITGK